MDCIICRKDRPGSEEHVFPESLGGTFCIWRVCRPCNNELGARADSPLIGFPLMVIQREMHQIPGKFSGPPDALKVLVGRDAVLTGTEHKVAIERDEDGKVGARLKIHKAVEVREDGSTVISVSMDAQDADKLPGIINGMRKKYGAAPLVSEELDAAVAEAMATLDASPVALTGSTTWNLDAPRLGLLKIGYELAFHWFGKTFLDSAEAEEMRQVLRGEKELRDSAVKAAFWLTEVGPFFTWQDEDCHVAFSMQFDGRANVAVRLFQNMAMMLDVGSSSGLDCGQVVKCDYVRRTTEHTTLVEQIARSLRR